MGFEENIMDYTEILEYLKKELTNSLQSTKIRKYQIIATKNNI